VRASTSIALIEELWAFTDDRIAVRFAYQYRNEKGQWFRLWQRELAVRQQRPHSRTPRHINDLAISEAERVFHWEQGRRPDAHPGLTGLHR
jgi:nuclear transport factor 2 (NTF2) superfamily protein